MILWYYDILWYFWYVTYKKKVTWWLFSHRTASLSSLHHSMLDFGYKNWANMQFLHPGLWTLNNVAPLNPDWLQKSCGVGILSLGLGIVSSCWILILPLLHILTKVIGLWTWDLLLEGWVCHPEEDEHKKSISPWTLCRASKWLIPQFCLSVSWHPPHTKKEGVQVDGTRGTKLASSSPSTSRCVVPWWV